MHRDAALEKVLLSRVFETLVNHPFNLGKAKSKLIKKESKCKRKIL